jgi:cytochrome P450 family 142 subfamily A polypeptide 1
VVTECGFDPLDLSKGLPHEGWRRLRAEAPVARTPKGIWFLARQAEVLAATRDVESFRSSFRDPGVVVPDEEMLISEIPEPRHGKVRKVVNSAIAAHRLGAIADFVRGLGRELLDKLAARGGGDLVTGLVRPIPPAAIGALLGTPSEDHEKLAHWSDEVVEGTYSTRNRNQRGEGLAGAHPEFAAYVDAQIEKHRAPDAPVGFITRLLRTEIDGYRMSHVELRTFLAFLLISGNETTRHLIGNLLHTLASRADLFARLREDPGCVPNAVEESLRVDPPVVFLLRECCADTELAGVRIRRGEKVAFGVASANRDESCYEAPDEFRLDRAKPTAHVAFGGGPHVCPGSALARLEGRVVLEVLRERVASLSLEPGFVRRKVPTFWANGPMALPVRLAAADPRS